MKRVFRHILNATRYSMQGIKAAWSTSIAFRIECTLGVVLTPISVILGETGSERALLILPLVIVLITELLNSGLESAMDRIGKETHPLSGQAKDMGSAAVFVSLISVPTIWGLVLLA